MIEFINVTKKYKDKTIIDNLNLEIGDNQLVAIIGASGCGKTTTLKMINRLIEPTSGRIMIDGRDIESMDKTELRRKTGYVIQQMGLFPHMTVRENIELIQRLEKKDENEIRENTRRLMKMMDLDEELYLDKYPSDLSGGQQQRIGVARALANSPDIILMDEPFSALDPITRSNLQVEIREIQKKTGVTIVFVTHDMDEAVNIADKICIMKDGNIAQYDIPENILKHPADEYVSSFVGKNRIWSSPEYIKVEDIMIKTPVTCSAEFTKSQCINRMVANHVDTLVVVDENMKFLGIVTRKSLYSSKNRFMTAEEMMIRNYFAVTPEDSIVDVLRSIEKYDVTNVPVVDRYGYLRGLITSSSLISVMGIPYISDETEKESEEQI